MRTPVFAAGAITLLSAACNRNQSEAVSALPYGAPVESPTARPTPPVASNPAQLLLLPAPVVSIYICEDGTAPKITLSGNLLNVELTVDITPVILSAGA